MTTLTHSYALTPSPYPPFPLPLATAFYKGDGCPAERRSFVLR